MNFFNNKFEFDPIDVGKLTVILSTLKRLESSSQEQWQENFIEKIRFFRMKMINQTPKNVDNIDDLDFNRGLIDYKLAELFFSYDLFKNQSLNDEKLFAYYSPSLELFEKCKFHNLMNFIDSCEKMGWNLYVNHLKICFNTFYEQENQTPCDDFHHVFKILWTMVNKKYLNYINVLSDSDYQDYLKENKTNFVEFINRFNNFDLLESPYFPECLLFLIFWLKKEIAELEDLIIIEKRFPTISEHSSFFEKLFFISTSGQLLNFVEKINPKKHEAWTSKFTNVLLQFFIKNIDHYHSCNLFRNIIDEKKISTENPDGLVKKVSQNVFWKNWMDISDFSDDSVDQDNVDLLIKICDGEKLPEIDFDLRKRLFELFFIKLVYNRLEDVSFVRMLFQRRLKHWQMKELLEGSKSHPTHQIEDCLKEEVFKNKSMLNSRNPTVKRSLFKLLLLTFLYPEPSIKLMVQHVLQQSVKIRNKFVSKIFANQLFDIVQSKSYKDRMEDITSNDNKHELIDFLHSIIVLKLTDHRERIISAQSFIDLLDNLLKTSIDDESSALIDLERLFINSICYCSGDCNAVKELDSIRRIIEIMQYDFGHQNTWIGHRFVVVISYLLQILSDSWQDPIKKSLIIELINLYCEKCDQIQIDSNSVAMISFMLNHFNHEKLSGIFSRQTLIFYIKKPGLETLFPPGQSQDVLLVAALKHYDTCFKTKDFQDYRSGFGSFPLRHFQALYHHQHGLINFTTTELQNLVDFLIEIYTLQIMSIVILDSFIVLIKFYRRFAMNQFIPYVRSIIFILENQFRSLKPVECPLEFISFVINIFFKLAMLQVLLDSPMMDDLNKQIRIEIQQMIHTGFKHFQQGYLNQFMQTNGLKMADLQSMFIQLKLHDYGENDDRCISQNDVYKCLTDRGLMFE